MATIDVSLWKCMGSNCSLATRVHSESLFEYSRIELYMPSLGKVKMLAQYPHDAWECCLGVRRSHAAIIFDMNRSTFRALLSNGKSVPREDAMFDIKPRSCKIKRNGERHAQYKTLCVMSPVPGTNQNLSSIWRVPYHLVSTNDKTKLQLSTYHLLPTTYHLLPTTY